jgi:hypothetical protein
MPGRDCSICRHERRREIDALLVGRKSYRDISGQFSVSRSALARHARAHLPVELARAAEVREREEADEQLGGVRRLQMEGFALLDLAKAEGDLKVALAALRELRQLLELSLRVQDVGELEKRLVELEELLGRNNRAA